MDEAEDVGEDDPPLLDGADDRGELSSVITISAVSLATSVPFLPALPVFRREDRDDHEQHAAEVRQLLFERRAARARFLDERADLA